MFASWRSKVKRNMDMKIEYNKLLFLAKEFEAGRDRRIDAKFWRESLDNLKTLNDGSVPHSSAIDSFEIIYHMFLRKHALSENADLDEILNELGGNHR